MRQTRQAVSVATRNNRRSRAPYSYRYGGEAVNGTIRRILSSWLSLARASVPFFVR
nr:MAG TPA: hypothetical protein [Caudoviricetes sp.]DAT22276.1 MAG TPA: hypothetical protein [Caudoviricetes sp.]